MTKQENIVTVNIDEMVEDIQPVIQRYYTKRLKIHPANKNDLLVYRVIVTNDHEALSRTKVYKIYEICISKLTQGWQLSLSDKKAVSILTREFSLKEDFREALGDVEVVIQTDIRRINNKRY